MDNLHYGTTTNIASTALSRGTYWAEVTQIESLRYQVVAHGLSAGELRDIEATVALTPQSVFQYALFGNQQVNVSGNATTDSYDSRLGSYASQIPTHDGDVGTNSTSAGGVSVGGRGGRAGHDGQHRCGHGRGSEVPRVRRGREAAGQGER